MRSNKIKHSHRRDTTYQFNSQCFEQQIRRQLSPLAKILNYDSRSKNSSKQARKKDFIKSIRYTSPSSYQNSQLLSKKQSTQKSKRFKNKLRDNNGANINMNIKKRKKKTADAYTDKQNNRLNNSQDKHIVLRIKQSAQIKKWKKTIYKKFIVQSLKVEQSPNLGSLQQSLKENEQIIQKQRSSKSFLVYSMGQANIPNQKRVTFLGVTRVIIIDWMYLISASLLLNRQTVHLAIHYLDSYFRIADQKQQRVENIHILAAAALLLSVKQQQRQMQAALLQTVIMSQKFQVVKEQVLDCQKQILMKLNFKLKSNTLAFWIDYFSLKWDSYLQSDEGERVLKQTNFQIKTKLRGSDGQSYKFYRQLMQLSDVCLMFGDYILFQKCKISLACIYLILRIESEKVLRKQSDSLFKLYHKQFMKKASPIFKDPYRINQIFNSFLTQICQFQITEIIPCIKFVANFLQLDFCYNIDQKALQQTKTYEDFIRRMTYSYFMKDYCLQKIK